MFDMATYEAYPARESGGVTEALHWTRPNQMLVDFCCITL